MGRQLKRLLEDVAFDVGRNREGDMRNQLTMNLGEFAQKVEQFSNLGKNLYNANNLMEMAKELKGISENAEAYIMKESDADWFDNVTIKRNMKELKNYVNEFVKVATEAQRMNHRMTALYEDSGRVLGRYFEIKEYIEGGGDEIDPRSENEKQVVQVPGMHPRESQFRQNDPKRIQGLDDEEASNEWDKIRKGISDGKRNSMFECILIKEDVNDEYPVGEWVKLDVPMLQYEQAMAFEKDLKKVGYKVLRKDWKERTGFQNEYAEFFVEKEQFNEANDYAVRTYPKFDMPTCGDDD